MNVPNSRSLRPRLRLPDGAHLFGDVDGHRAPGNAAPTAHAARSAKLIDPGGELMRHPLAIPRSGRGANAPTVDVGKVHGEARIPFLPPLRSLTRQIGHILDRGAETRRANHGAVGAGKASCRYVVPAWMLVVAVKQPLDVGRIHASAHLGRGTGHHTLGG